MLRFWDILQLMGDIILTWAYIETQFNSYSKGGAHGKLRGLVVEIWKQNKGRA